jgi:hypothetical protein
MIGALVDSCGGGVDVGAGDAMGGGGDGGLSWGTVTEFSNPRFVIVSVFFPPFPYFQINYLLCQMLTEV